MEFDPVRWAVYLTVGPVVLAAFFLFGSLQKKLLALIAVVIFLEGVLLTWRAFFFVGFGISSALCYAFIILILLMPSARSRMPALTLPWMAFLFFALMGAIIGSFTRGAGLADNTVLFQMFYLEGLFYFWIGRAALKDSEEAQKVLTWLVIFGGLTAILHLFAVMTGYRFYSSSAQVFDVYSTVAFRYGGAFTNPNTLADFYAMLIPVGLVLGLGWSRPRPVAMQAIILSLSLMGVSLLLTASRGGLAATLLVSVIAVILLPIQFHRIAALAAISVVASGFAAVLLLLVFPEFYEKTIARFLDEGIASTRYETWKLTLQLLSGNPLGTGLHHSGYLEGIKQVGFRISTPHNIYMGIAVSAGIPGLVAFLAIVTGVINRIRLARRFGDARLRTVATALMVLVLGFLVSGMTEPIYRNGIKLQHLFWLFAGLGSTLPAWLAAESRSPHLEGEVSGLDPIRGSENGSLLEPQRIGFP